MFLCMGFQLPSALFLFSKLLNTSPSITFFELHLILKSCPYASSYKFYAFSPFQYTFLFLLTCLLTLNHFEFPAIHHQYTYIFFLSLSDFVTKSIENNTSISNGHGATAWEIKLGKHGRNKVLCFLCGTCGYVLFIPKSHIANWHRNSFTSHI